MRDSLNILVKEANLMLAIPKIVCLVGSTRFVDEFIEAQFQESVAGKIVLTVGCFPRNKEGNWDRMKVTDEQKIILDKLHLTKIDLCDEVLVIDVGGYIGESTTNEITYATKIGKVIRYRSNEFIYSLINSHINSQTESQYV